MILASHMCVCWLSSFITVNYFFIFDSEETKQATTLNLVHCIMETTGGSVNHETASFSFHIHFIAQKSADKFS